MSCETFREAIGRQRPLERSPRAREGRVPWTVLQEAATVSSVQAHQHRLRQTLQSSYARSRPGAVPSHLQARRVRTFRCRRLQACWCETSCFVAD